MHLEITLEIQISYRITGFLSKVQCVEVSSKPLYGLDSLFPLTSVPMHLEKALL